MLDKATRNTLRATVTNCRRTLEVAIGDTLEGQYGIHKNGTIEPISALTLDTEDHDYRKQIVAHLQHLVAGGMAINDAIGRLIREVAFTHLNRLCAYKMAERRGLIRETISRGQQSNGFKRYLADHDEDDLLWQQGQTDRAYRHFLGWTGRKLAQEVTILFSPNDPANPLFPSPPALTDVLDLLNAPVLASIWDEDETLGWIYQFFTPKELRDRVRKESQAPRNSYELSFRNQFYTPRYVVEFLTDNTLGRLWYEMRGGQTALASRPYLVRHHHEIWLAQGEMEPQPFIPQNNYDQISDTNLWLCPNPELSSWDDINAYAMMFNGYHYVTEAGLAPDPMEYLSELLRRHETTYDQTEQWQGTFTDLRLCLFFLLRRFRTHMSEPTGDDVTKLNMLYQALCTAWDREVDIIAPREKQSPLEFRVLDPACGSGHFLLYAFDLLVTIYEEAWDDPELSGALRSLYPGGQAAYLSDIPSLILEHNLYGIDIDPRATQIAALALWLRAHREYDTMGIPIEQRSLIRRANMICAEPMPGEITLKQDLLQQVQPLALQPIIQSLWDAMKLAGEMGSLLKLEELLASAIDQAKREWLSQPKFVNITLFEDAKKPEQKMLEWTGISNVRFFDDEARSRVIIALHTMAARQANGDGITSTLFASDAERGVALLDAMLHRYDVVLMNPPFGDASLPAKAAIEKAYPRTKNDLFAAFVERGLQVLKPRCRVGAITSRAGFFLTSFQKWREEVLLNEGRLVVVADLGYGVLDAAMVETAAYVLEKIET